MQGSENNESPAVPNPNQAAPVMPQPPTAVPPMAPAVPAAPIPAPQAVPQASMNMTSQPVAPIVPGQMEPQANSQNPKSSKDFFVLLAALIPIVGIVMGIIFTAKGAKQKDKRKGIIGISTVILSLIIGSLSFFFLLPLISGAKYSKTQVVNLKLGDSEYKITIPEAFKSDNPPDNTQGSYVINSEKKDETEDVAQFRYDILDQSFLNGEFEGVTLTPDNLIDELLTREDKYKSDLKSTAESAGLKDVVVSNIVREGKSITTNFTGKNSDGTVMKGVAKDYVDKNFYIVQLTVIASKKVWDSNSKSFNGILTSLDSQIN